MYSLTSLSVQKLFVAMSDDDLRKQVHLLTMAVQQIQSRGRQTQSVCMGQRRPDHHTYRKNRDMGTYWHEAHVIDSDPEGLFAAYHLLPSAPIEMLWDQMSLEGPIAEDRLEVFTYIRDHRDLYERCVRVWGIFVPFLSVLAQGTHALSVQGAAGIANQSM